MESVRTELSWTTMDPDNLMSFQEIKNQMNF